MGMTLVEVMLAVAILGVGFAVLLTAASRCLAAVKMARGYQEAEWTFSMGEAENPLFVTNDVESLIVAPTTYDNGFTFSRDIEDDEDEDGLYVVRARVTWSERGRKSFDEVVSYIFVPEKEEE